MSSSQERSAQMIASLHAVARERTLREAQPGLSEKLSVLKRYQQARLVRTHADLLANPRYAAAAQFFFEDLYGPRDYARRDAQLERIVPAISRLLPEELAHAVVRLLELHALTEELDSAMAAALPAPEVDAPRYVQAWQAVGRPQDRERQVQLVHEVGEALDHYTRLPMISVTLKMMRAPARAAGLEELQHFLETGFFTFKAMKGAQFFLGSLEQRERALCKRLFEADALQVASSPRRAEDVALGQLP